MASAIDEMLRSLHTFVEEDNGATAIEYALIASAVGLVLVPLVDTLGNFFIAEYNTIMAAMAAFLS